MSKSIQTSKIPNPPGYKSEDVIKDFESARGERTAQQKQQNILKMKQKAAWDYATGQVKALMPLGFMAYMSGNTLNLWTIMITFNTVSTPIKNLLNSVKEFERFKDTRGRVDTLLPMLIYMSIWLGALALALVKLDYIGILPKQLLDGVAAMPPAKYVEVSAHAAKL